MQFRLNGGFLCWFSICGGGPAQTIRHQILAKILQARLYNKSFSDLLWPVDCCENPLFLRLKRLRVWCGFSKFCVMQTRHFLRLFLVLNSELALQAAPLQNVSNWRVILGPSSGILLAAHQLLQSIHHLYPISWAM